jgi:hypothetical protein
MLGRVQHLKKKGTGRHSPKKQGQHEVQDKYDRQLARPAKGQDCPETKCPEEGADRSALADQ